MTTYAPDTVTRPHEWRARAACTLPGANPDWWDAPGPTLDGQTAITWCRACPVRTPCLTLAMRAEGTSTESHRSGIYGGLTPAERRALYEHYRSRGRA